MRLFLIFSMFFSATSVFADGPSRSEIETHLQRLTPSVYRLESFEFKNFPSLVESGAGRTSVVGKLALSTDLYEVDPLSVWLIGRLSDEGVENKFITKTLDQIRRRGKPKAYTIINRAGLKTTFSFETNYRSTVSGVDFGARNNGLKIDTFRGFARNNIPESGYVSGSAEGENLVQYIVGLYAAERRSDTNVERLQDSVEEFFSSKTKIRRHEGDPDKPSVIYTASCGPTVSWQKETVKGRYNYEILRSEVECAANFSQSHRFLNVTIGAGNERQVRYVIKVYDHPSTGLNSEVSEFVRCVGNDGGAFCQDGKWHGSDLATKHTMDWDGTSFRRELSGYYAGQARVLE